MVKSEIYSFYRGRINGLWLVMLFVSSCMMIYQDRSQLITYLLDHLSLSTQLCNTLDVLSLGEKLFGVILLTLHIVSMGFYGLQVDDFVILTKWQ